MLDPYLHWLGIGTRQRPISPYQLLGLSPDVRDPRIIEDATMARMACVRIYQNCYPEVAARILNEIAQAFLVLTTSHGRKTHERNSFGQTARTTTLLARKTVSMPSDKPGPVGQAHGSTPRATQLSAPRPSTTLSGNRPRCRTTELAEPSSGESSSPGKTGCVWHLELSRVTLPSAGAQDQPAPVNPDTASGEPRPRGRLVCKGLRHASGQEVLSVLRACLRILQAQTFQPAR